MRGVEHTLIPNGFAQDLMATGGRLGNGLGWAVLLDFGIVALGVAPVLVEAGGPHLVLEFSDVDGRHGVELRHPATRDGHALGRYRRMRGAGRGDG